MVDSALLEEVKSYINFTWEDSAKEQRIEKYIESSIQYLNGIAGAEIDYDRDLLARDLLKNRVLYYDSQAIDDFAKNYNGLLEELRITYLVHVNEDTRQSVQQSRLAFQRRALRNMHN